MAGDKALSVKEHEEEWDEILNNVNGAVDIMAFQDGQVDYHELYDYLVINKKLADKYNLTLLPEIHASYGEKNYEQIAGKGYMTYDFFLPGRNHIELFFQGGNPFGNGSYIELWP